MDRKNVIELDKDDIRKINRSARRKALMREFGKTRMDTKAMRDRKRYSRKVKHKGDFGDF